MKVAVAILAIWEYLGLAKKWINLYRIIIGIHRITISQTSVLKPPDFSLNRPVMPYQMSVRVRDSSRNFTVAVTASATGHSIHAQRDSMRKNVLG